MAQLRILYYKYIIHIITLLYYNADIEQIMIIYR